MKKSVKPVLFASPVKDLTLARYLAAMDVDFLGIELDDFTPLQIQQLRDWIAGPKLIGISSDPSRMLDHDINLDGYYMDSDIKTASGLLRFYSYAYYIQQHPEDVSFVLIDSVDEVIPSKSCLLKVSMQDEIFIPENIQGLVFVPGKEEKTGLYDFDNLEHFFESLVN